MRDLRRLSGGGVGANEEIRRWRRKGEGASRKRLEARVRDPRVREAACEATAREIVRERASEACERASERERWERERSTACRCERETEEQQRNARYGRPKVACERQ